MHSALFFSIIYKEKKMKYKMKNKIPIILIIFILIIIFINCDLINNMKLGNSPSVLIDKNKNGYEIDLIDLNIIISILFNTRTYNIKLDSLLDELYKTEEYKISEIRYNFINYLYDKYKGNKYKTDLFAYYYNQTIGYDINEIQYHWIEFKRKNINKSLIDYYSYRVSSNFLLFSTYSAIYKINIIYPQYNLLVDFLLNNRDLFSDILKNNYICKKIHNFFDNFINSFELDSIICDYCNYYSIQKNEMYKKEIYVYFKWFTDLSYFNNNNQYFFYGAQIFQNIILIKGIADNNKIKTMLLHELGHFFSNNYEKNFFTKKENIKLDDFLYYCVMIDPSSSTSEDEKKMIFEKIKNINSQDLKNLLVEVIADVSLFYFINENKEYQNLLEYCYQLNYIVKNDKDKYEFKNFQTNLYYKLIEYIVFTAIKENIRLEKIMFIDENERDKIFLNMINAFINDFLTLYLENGEWKFILDY